MRAAVTRLRSELRVRSLSWLTLALIVAIVAGASIAAAMGAQRTDTAYDRFTVDRHAADVELYNTPNPQIPIADLTPATRLPQVIEAAPLKYFAISDSSANAYAAPDERAYGTEGLNRLKILDGRAARPDRAGARRRSHPGRPRPQLAVAQPGPTRSESEGDRRTTPTD